MITFENRRTPRCVPEALSLRVAKPAAMTAALQSFFIR
jgi:hypothetical protein